MAGPSRHDGQVPQTHSGRSPRCCLLTEPLNHFDAHQTPGPPHRQHSLLVISLWPPSCRPWRGCWLWQATQRALCEVHRLLWLCTQPVEAIQHSSNTTKKSLLDPQATTNWFSSVKTDHNRASCLLTKGLCCRGRSPQHSRSAAGPGGGLYICGDRGGHLPVLHTAVRQKQNSAPTCWGASSQVSSRILTPIIGSIQ